MQPHWKWDPSAQHPAPRTASQPLLRSEPGSSAALSFSRAAGRALTRSSASRGGFLTGGVLGPGIFSNDRGSSSSQWPIDAIFHFHQALRKDLEYLSAESARLATCDDDATRDFSSRFHFLWGLYRVHSNAEDEIVFPALEAKEALHNESGGEAEREEARKQVKELEERRRELAERVHRMSLSVRLCLDQHISREELELWPLFGIHFSMEEQDAIVGHHGRRGAAGVAIRPRGAPWGLSGTEWGSMELMGLEGWGTTGRDTGRGLLGPAISDEEQAGMVDTWRKASRNTMSDQWLSAWWKSPAGTSNPLPPSPGHQGHARDDLADSLSSDALQMVAEYLESDGSRQAAGAEAAEPGDVVAATRVDASCADGAADAGAAASDGGAAAGCHGGGCGHGHAVGTASDREGVGGEGCSAAGECGDGRSGNEAVGGEGGSGSGCGGGGRAGGESGDRGGGSGAQGKEVEKDKRTFRPGWHNIFRMNQKELEAAIRRVSSDSSLDPGRKAYLMQNLMTSRWIVAQQQQHKSSRDTPEEEVLCASYHDEEKGIYGCQHYRRNCKVRAVCCGKLVSCRFCHDKVADHAMDRWVHNTTRSPTMPWTGGFTTGQGRQPCHGQVGSQQDKVANHAMDRHAVKEMMCMKFLKVQPVGQHCATPSCNGYSMAKHYCSICKLFDDARDIYHCPFCNLCRVGRGLGIDYFHCMTCNACMSVTLAQHTCREKGLESNCPICHDFLFTSSAPVKALPCGHFMHSACFLAYTCEHYTCPICCKSVGDMRVYFGMLDALLAAEQLPEEYRNRQQVGPPALSCLLNQT
ncbi:unnamed protein product [Closterium sp. NIES-65]|nr:unnamed protein product [Closterium sp. NIES-65]